MGPVSKKISIFSPVNWKMGSDSFNILLNDFFFYLYNLTVYYFVDDNTLPSFAKIVNNFVNTLESGGLEQ